MEKNQLPMYVNTIGSASKVREIINTKKNADKLLKYIPETTYRILVEKKYYQL